MEAEERDTCTDRLCNSQEENLQHLLSGCTVLAGSEYLTRHNQALMVFAVEWAKHKGLIPENARWYKEKWKSGEVYENNEYKMIWDFQFKLKKTEKARRPDLILEDHAEKNIYIVDMAVPMERNVVKKRRSKLTKYQQLAYETRIKRKGYNVYVVPLIIGCCGSGADTVLKELTKFFTDNISYGVLKEMLKTVVMHSESILRKVLGGLKQT